MRENIFLRPPLKNPWVSAAYFVNEWKIYGDKSWQIILMWKHTHVTHLSAICGVLKKKIHTTIVIFSF